MVWRISCSRTRRVCGGHSSRTRACSGSKASATSRGSRRPMPSFRRWTSSSVANGPPRRHVGRTRTRKRTSLECVPVAIFDMAGVLYRGSIVMPYAKETLERLRRAGWQVFFATNNSTATRNEYVARLTPLGLGGDLEHVITSAYATAHYLERLQPKPKDVMVVGADGLRSEIRAVGIAVRAADALPGIHPPPD